MCIVCTEWIKGKLTNEEAISAIGELINTGDDEDMEKNIEHYLETIDKIADQDEEQGSTD